MSKKKPNNFIAPIVIAGITVGFLASAYKFVFAKPKKQSSEIVSNNMNLKTNLKSDCVRKA